MKLAVGIADDHPLFLQSLGVLIDSFPGVEVILRAYDGEDLLRKLMLAPQKPDILLIDVQMPVMDGAQAAQAISTQYPAIRMIALSMKDDPRAMERMTKAGCYAYLLKDIDPAELQKVLFEAGGKI